MKVTRASVSSGEIFSLSPIVIVIFGFVLSVTPGCRSNSGRSNETLQPTPSREESKPAFANEVSKSGSTLAEKGGSKQELLSAIDLL